MNDNELRELAKYIESLGINPKWTADAMFEILKEKPDLADEWARIMKEGKEKVDFT